MKGWEIFRFEIGLQARRASTWLYLVVLLAITWRLAIELYVANARIGGFWFNAPFVVAVLTLFSSIMALVACSAIAGDVAARDAATRMHPLLYTAPVTRGAYLGGRYAAALALGAMLVLATPVALLLAVYVTRPEADLIGPFRLASYVGAYLFVALPNVVIGTALAFAASALTRRAMAAWVVNVALFAVMVSCWLYLAAKLGRWDLARVFDPFGLTPMAELSRSWTAAEKNAGFAWMDGRTIVGRAVWLAIALGALAWTYLRFRFAHLAAGDVRARGATADAPEESRAPRVAPVARVTVPHAHRSHGRLTRVWQTLAVARESLRVIMLGWGGIAFAAMALLVAVTGPGLMMHLDVPMIPTTSHLSAYLGQSGDVFALVVPLCIAFYAGELVWRERDAGLAEMADATPVPEWAYLAGRGLGLAGSIVLLQAMMLAASLVVQARMGHTRFELGLATRLLFGLQLTDHLLFALLAVAVHVLVNQKYVGHMVVILVYAFMSFAAALGIEHGMLVFGSDPGWVHSDMRGFGPFLGPWLALKAYWAAWVLLLAVAARLLWARGREQTVQARLRTARLRLTRRVVAAGAVAIALVVSLGGFVFYNTNVLNAYRPYEEGVATSAEYERRYGHYRATAQPTVSHMALRAELHPSRRRAEIRGTYRLVNRRAVAIDSIVLATSPSVETRDLTFDRPARRVLADDRLDLFVYALATPLQPGDSLRLDFAVRYAPRGFVNRGVDAAVSPRATFIRQFWLPTVGYRSDRELDNPGDRRLHGLSARPAIPSPRDTMARHDVAPTGGERATLDVVVSTEAAQTAIAPGRLVRSWTSAGRRHFHYVTDAPIRKDFSIYSAVYAVHRGRWTDPAGRPVDIEIVHHPGHAWNVARMEQSVRASLAYLSARLAPYPHGQLRLVEHPGRGVSLHASPVNVSYTEGFAILDPANDARDIDFAYAVVAHEVAHQWWGNLVTPAHAQGGALLSESLAWYSALAVVEQTHGRAHLERLLAMMREAYLSPRARAGEPLLYAFDWFNGYRKGMFAMYSLREHVGDARVHVALRRMVERYGAGTPPLPTSLDLYAELRAVTPDSLHPLLVDLFERNAYWQLATDSATAVRDGAGTWRVTLDVRARKVVVDTVGAESPVPMDDVVEVAVYGAGENGRPAAPLYLRGHRLRAGATRITVTVPREPVRAVVDPRGLLIDVEPEDNGAAVRVGERPS